MIIGNIYVISAVAVVGGALFGFDISSMSAILGTNSYKCYFNQGPRGPPFNDDAKCSGPTSLRQGGITAAMPAGSWLGALISGFLSDILGRRYAIMIGCIIWYVFFLPRTYCISCMLTRTTSTQAYRISHLLCFTKHGYADCGSYHQRLFCRNRVCPGSRLHFGTLAAVKAWSSGWFTTMGYYLGYFDHVLVC